MSTMNKAIAAGVGGGVAGAGMGIYSLPDGSPWYAYVIMALIGVVVPAVFTYKAPPNKE